jgi:hypothetical protein
MYAHSKFVEIYDGITGKFISKIRKFGREQYESEHIINNEAYYWDHRKKCLTFYDVNSGEINSTRRKFKWYSFNERYDFYK